MDFVVFKDLCSAAGCSYGHDPDERGTVNTKMSQVSRRINSVARWAFCRFGDAICSAIVLTGNGQKWSNPTFRAAVPSMIIM